MTSSMIGRTGGEHALDEVVDIAEDNSESFWPTALLGRQWFELDAL